MNALLTKSHPLSRVERKTFLGEGRWYEGSSITNGEGLPASDLNFLRITPDITTAATPMKKAETAKSGEVIVALTENGNTLKRLFWEGNKPRLHAENKSYPSDKIDIYPKELTIQGIALKVVRDIK